MFHKFQARPLALLVVLLMTFTAAVTLAGGAEAGKDSTTAAKTVAENKLGEMRTRFVGGETANGRTVTGKFYPLDFRRDNGKLKVRGMLAGVVHNTDGSTSTFTAVRSLTVKRINGTPIAPKTSAAALGVCDILKLVLGPLDLDLLGLQVHLDRVRLIVEAVSGAGNLLGNLLCAVAGLLDEGLDGILGQLAAVLDDILGALRLGL
jgi:hypothetical protein